MSKIVINFHGYKTYSEPSGSSSDEIGWHLQLVMRNVFCLGLEVLKELVELECPFCISHSSLIYIDSYGFQPLGIVRG